MTLEELLQLPSDDLYAITNWEVLLTPYLPVTRPKKAEEKPVKSASTVKTKASLGKDKNNIQQRFTLRMMELAQDASLTDEEIKARIQSEFGTQFLS